MKWKINDKKDVSPLPLEVMCILCEKHLENDERQFIGVITSNISSKFLGDILSPSQITFG